MTTSHNNQSGWASGLYTRSLFPRAVSQKCVSHVPSHVSGMHVKKYSAQCYIHVISAFFLHYKTQHSRTKYAFRGALRTQRDSINISNGKNQTMPLSCKTLNNRCKIPCISQHTWCTSTGHTWEIKVQKVPWLWSQGAKLLCRHSREDINVPLILQHFTGDVVSNRIHAYGVGSL